MCGIGTRHILRQSDLHLPLYSHIRFTLADWIVRPVQEQQQQEQQPAERDWAEDGARLLALHRDRERLHSEASSLWQSFSAAVLAAGPHTMDLPGERSNKFDFVKQGLRMRRCRHRL